MLSKFAHKVYVGHQMYVIFNSILFEPILLPKEKVEKIWKNQLNALTSSELEILNGTGILIVNPFQDKKVEEIIKNSINNKKDEINLLYIIPYSGCNLCCKYCFIGQIPNETAISMDLKTAENSLNFFIKHLRKTNQKKGKIIFYGGEPTMGFDIIKYMVLKAKKINFPILFSIITNATTLTEEMISFCKNNQLSIGISLDGPKEKNDINRLFKNQKKSVYDTVLKKIELLKKNSVEFGLSVTLSENLLEDKTFFNWLKNMETKNINFNLLHYTSPNNNWKKYYKKASRFLFKAYDILSPLGIKDDRIFRKIRAFSGENLKFNDCNAVGAQQLTIKPNGDITICHGYWNTAREVIGNVNKKNLQIENIFKNKTYQKWKHNLTINKNKCLKCPALYICGTGCPKQSEDLFGSQYEIDRAFCIHSKYTLRELLKRSIKSNLI